MMAEEEYGRVILQHTRSLFLFLSLDRVGLQVLAFWELVSGFLGLSCISRIPGTKYSRKD